MLELETMEERCLLAWLSGSLALDELFSTGKVHLFRASAAHSVLGPPESIANLDSSPTDTPTGQCGQGSSSLEASLLR